MADKKYFVYVIESKGGLRYIGRTNNLETRLEQHKAGLSFRTKRNAGWRIINTESYHTRNEAICREKFIKSGQRRKWLKSILPSQNG